jgi:alkylhydroperoxidase family enzyme
LTTDIAARMEQVTGQPPRIEAPGEEALDPRGVELIERMRGLVGFPRKEPVHHFFATMSLQPDFFDGFMRLGLAVMGSASLGARERELVILRTGWLLGAPYQFGEHVIQARHLGVTAEEIARVKLGSSAEGWSPLERALLKAAEELHADAMISDETWAALAERLAPAELIELPMIVGHYTLTAFVQNSLRIRLNPQNPGLASA